jgi:para-nitrobenzyl esterase
MLRLLLAAAVLAATSLAEGAIPSEVTIDSGTLAGTTGASAEIRAFKGIPFAAPPVGANRWRTGDPNGVGLPAWPAYRDVANGKAQVLGDTVTTETASLPAATTLAFFDSAYQQLLKGGANQ